MIKNILFNLVLIFLSTFGISQNCYKVIGDIQGMNLDISSLETISCQLKDSLPSEFRDDFKVLYFGFYLYSSTMQNAIENFRSNAISMADIESPYYLLLSRQLSWNGDIKYYIDIKLPSNWLPFCYDPLILESFENSIKNKFKNGTEKYKNASDRVILESEALQYTSNKFGKYTSCCIPDANLRNNSQCTDCISAYDVLNELENLGFEPYFVGEVTNSLTTEDQNCLCTHSESSLKDNNENGNRSSSINDFANLTITIDDITYNFGQEQSDWVAAGNTAIVTKNKNYCITSLFANQTTLNNGSANVAWIHVFENPDSTQSDIIFAKIKYNFDNSNLQPEDFQIQSIQGDPLPPFNYKITHRSFAPWDRFGHIPVFWNIHKNRNSFNGDNRGFSLANSNGEGHIDNHGVSARIHQTYSIQLGKGEFGEEKLPNPFNSVTTGYRYCIKEIIIPQPPPLQPITIYAKEVSEMGGSKGFERFRLGNNNIFFTSMFFEGSNPLFVPGPDIEWFLDLGWYYKKSENSIYIDGRIIGKEYPAYESFIEDECGNKVFLHTYQAPCESALGGELLWPLPDYNQTFGLFVKVDSKGCFTGLMKVGNSSTTIADWNNLNTSKSPAKDCPSSPCEGCYPNDNSDKREFYDCHD